MVGDLSVGDARLDYQQLYDDWFDHWLKGEEEDTMRKMPRIKYYTMGINQWQTAEVWPPADTRMKTFYLGSQGKANTLNGDGVLDKRPPGQDQPDTFVL